MTQPVRLAILGTGRWGNHLLRNFLAHPHVEVVGIVEKNEATLAETRQRYDLRPGQCVSDWTPWLESAALDAVVIATPAVTHELLIQTALSHKLHVLVEKPMTLRSDTCATLTQLAQQQNCQLVVDHTYLFHPAVQTGQQLVKSESLGALRYGYATRTNLGPVRYDVDALWDLALHDIAIFNNWLGRVPTQVSAVGTIWLQSQANPQFPQGLNDVGWLTLTYAPSFQAVIHVSWLNPDKQRRLGIVGEAGTLVLDELSPEGMLSVYRGELLQQDEGWVPKANPQREQVSVPAGEPLHHVCDHFLKSIQTNQASSLSGGEVATALVRILEAASQSALDGGRAVLIQYL